MLIISNILNRQAMERKTNTKDKWQGFWLLQEWSRKGQFGVWRFVHCCFTCVQVSLCQILYFSLGNVILNLCSLFFLVIVISTSVCQALILIPLRRRKSEPWWRYVQSITDWTWVEVGIMGGFGNGLKRAGLGWPDTLFVLCFQFSYIY